MSNNDLVVALSTDYQYRAMKDFIKMKVTVLHQELDQKATENLQGFCIPF